MYDPQKLPSEQGGFVLVFGPDGKKIQTRQPVKQKVNDLLMSN
jgi:hypothetical protein